MLLPDLLCRAATRLAKQKDWYKQCYDWVYAALAEVKPGATTADAAKHFPEAKLWGYPGEEWAVCSQWGHGHRTHPL